MKTTTLLLLCLSAVGCYRDPLPVLYPDAGHLAVHNETVVHVVDSATSEDLKRPEDLDEPTEVSADATPSCGGKDEPCCEDFVCADGLRCVPSECPAGVRPCCQPSL